MKTALILSKGDNVATLLQDIQAGETVEVKDWNRSRIALIQSLSRIPAGHKIMLQDVSAGTQINKYGHCIGRASASISAGERVHVHNLESMRGRGDLT